MSTRLLMVLSGIFCIAVIPDATLAEGSSTAGQRFHLPWSMAAKDLLETTVPESKESLVRQLGERAGEFRFDPDCGFGGSADYACFVGEYGIHYVPPYPAALPYSTPTLPGPGHLVNREWAPLELVRNGSKLLQEWKTQAAFGYPFDCEQSFCAVIVKATRDDKPARENWYSVCRVAKVRGIVGAPQRCRQVAIESEVGTWIWAIVGSYSAAASMGLPDFSFRIHGVPPEHLLPANNSVAEKIAQFIGAPPLNLQASLYGDHTVIGAASFRASAVLPGWREIVTVRVDLRRQGWNEPEYLGVAISTTFYVNRQNTRSPSDWSLPTQQQEAAYLKHVRANVTNAVTAICSVTMFKTPDDVVCQP